MENTTRDNRDQSCAASATIVIVGAGEAGVAAAAAVRETHAGPVILINGEDRLPYERPPLSKAVLSDETPEPKAIRAADWYQDNGVDLWNDCRVTKIIPSERALKVSSASEERTINYGRLLLATGATPRRLPPPNNGVFYLRTYEDSLALREALRVKSTLLVIGAGVIGLEIASIARRRGLRVTVVDIGDRIMSRAVTPEVSASLLELHLSEGVDVKLNVGSVSVEDSGSRQTILLGNGTRLHSDIVVAGIGVTPDTRLAADAGCAIENGIIVDGRGQTTIDGIYAAGDVASFLHPLFQRAMRVEAWQHAGRHGSHVGRAMVGLVDDYREVPWFWSDQFGLNLQVVGDVMGADDTVWRGEADVRTGFHFANGRLVAATTLNNGRDIRPATKLIVTGFQGSADLLTDRSVPLGKIVSKLLASDPQTA